MIDWRLVSDIEAKKKEEERALAGGTVGVWYFFCFW